MKLPDNMPDLGNIWGDLAAFQKFLSEFHATLQDPSQRETLGAVLNRLNKKVDEAKAVVPGIVAGMKNEAEGLKAQAEEELKEFDRHCAEVKEQILTRQREEAQPPAAPPAPPAVNPTLGPVLASELIAQFFPAATQSGKRPLADAGSVARAWNEPTEQEAEEPKDVAPERRTQPKSGPKKKRGDDIWEGLSRMEE